MRRLRRFGNSYHVLTGTCYRESCHPQVGTADGDAHCQSDYAIRFRQGLLARELRRITRSGPILPRTSKRKRFLGHLRGRVYWSPVTAQDPWLKRRFRLFSRT
jgi:hypothetical protein